MELFDYHEFSSQDEEKNEAYKSFFGGLKFGPNNFFGPVLAGFLEQVIINPDAQRLIQLSFSKYFLYFSKYPQISYILENAFWGVENLRNYVDKDSLAQELSSISNEMGEEMGNIIVLYTLSSEFNCQIVLLQNEIEPIFIKANCYIHPITIYFVLNHEIRLDSSEMNSESRLDSLELLLGRKFEDSIIPFRKKSVIQDINSKLRILLNKYSSRYQNTDLNSYNQIIPELPIKNIKIIPIEEEKIKRISEREIPKKPKSFPSLYKTVLKSENSVKTKTDEGPPESMPNQNIPKIEIPKIDIYKKFNQVSYPINKELKKWDSENLPQSFRIKKVAIINSLMLEPLNCIINIPSTSFFSNLLTINKDDLSNLILPNGESEENEVRNKEDPIIIRKEVCESCIKQEFCNVPLSCNCSMCFPCLFKSASKYTCIKCSFSLSKCDRDIISIYTW